MPWNKGLTKETDASVMKISQTMRRKKIKNFQNWRNKNRVHYRPLLPSSELAEYIGVVLGDGNISKFPRTERIIISCNSNNQGFTERYRAMTEDLFGKKPTVNKISGANCVRISLYQKHIAKRLKIPTGDRSRLVFRTPVWILKNKPYLVAFLRGLFEAEGSFSIHKPTYTYNFQFTNLNKSLLNAVRNGLRALGFHPEVRKTSIRLRKKHEVANFKNLIRFREY